MHMQNTPRRAGSGGIGLASVAPVPSDLLSARVEQLSARAGAVYRWFADVDRDDAALRALWLALASHEDGYRNARGDGRRDQEADAPAAVWSTQVATKLREVARHLAAAERLDTHDAVDRRLAAALAVELARFELCRRTNGQPECWCRRHEGDIRALADLAVQRSRSPRVRLAAAVLLTRHNLADGATRCL